MDRKLKKIITVAFIFFVLYMYFPFYIVYFVEDSLSFFRSWMPIYTYFSPFTILPIIVGVMSLIVNKFYKNIVLRILFLGFFAYATFINFYSLESGGYFYFYLPYIILIILHFKQWIKEFRSRIKNYNI